MAEGSGKPAGSNPGRAPRPYPTPSRSGEVLARHAGLDTGTGQLLPDKDGGPRRLVLSTDFYRVYESAGKKADGLVNLFCAAHLRRHFVRAGDANPAQLGIWTRDWLDRFRDLYRAHDELTAAWMDSTAPAPREREAAAERLEKAYAGWDEAITTIDTVRKKQAQAPGLQEPAKKPSPPWTANGKASSRTGTTR